MFNKDLFEWSQSISKIGTWFLDISENRVYWSEETYRIHELNSEIEVEVEEAISFYHMDDREMINQAVNDCIKHGKPWDLIARIITADHNMKSVRAAGRPIFDENNKLIRLEGIFQELDVSKSVAEDATFLSKRNHFIEKLTNDVIIIAKTDPKGRITFVNDKFCEISKYSRSELMGQDHKILNSGFHPKEFFIEMWKTIRAKKTWRNQIKNIAKDGSYYWVDTTIRPVLGDDGEILEFVSFRLEITKQKELESSEIKMAKLAAVGETTAQIIHDVMNPLAIIQGNAEKIEKHIEREEIDRAAILKGSDRIQHSVDRVKELFGGLRRGLLKDNTLVEISFCKLIKEIYSDLEEIAEDAKVELRLDQLGDFKLVGDRQKLRQAFTNLVKNGIDAGKDKPNSWVDVRLLSIGAFKVVQVTDSGNGIPEAYHEKIFESLFTTKKEKGGTGLGLGLVKKIIEAHSGIIRVNPDSPNTQMEVMFTT
ncbi:MAG: PAS domain-containing sensor histidine kinase [Bdellovibrionota bacterium]|nr:PAS domain-containing sensor histidine kinase [Bdellovibrionota bacterium]